MASKERKGWPGTEVGSHSVVREDGSREARVKLSRADGFVARLIGLMGRPEIDRDRGLVFERCRSVHTLFMRSPIDIVWLSSAAKDGSRSVVSVDAAVPPWRFLMGPRGAEAVMEIAPGTLPEGVFGRRLVVDDADGR